MYKSLTAALLLALAHDAAAVSTTFTYQGSLTDGGSPANGAYDLRFQLITPGPAPAPIVLEDVAVSGGLFSVELDFGAAIAGSDYSLAIGVRPGASSGAFTALAPNTPIRPSPQAQVAAIASEAVTVSPGAVNSVSIADGSVGSADINDSQVQRRVNVSCPAGQAMRVVAADGSVNCVAVGSVTNVATGVGLTGGPITTTGTISVATGGIDSAMIADGAVGSNDINAATVQRRVSGACATGSIQAIAQDGTVTCNTSADWSLAGNTGTDPLTQFLGTTDAKPLVVRTQNVQSMRLESTSPTPGGAPNSANVIAGGSTNFVTAGVRGATVAGGGAVLGSEGGLFTGGPNRVTDNYGFAAGGFANIAGNSNVSTDDSSFATVVGGNSNVARGQSDAIIGGANNITEGPRALVAGGSSNTATGFSAAAIGGESNCAGGDFSFAAGQGAAVRPANGTDISSCGAVSASADANGDEGTFVWADSSTTNRFVSSGPNQFLVRADGGVMFNTNTLPGAGSDDLVIGAREAGDDDADLRLLTRNGRSVSMFVRDSNGSLVFQPQNLTAGTDRLVVGGGVGGNATLSNGGSWNNASSRTFKERFASVDPLAVLAGVLDLPILRWNYIGSSEGTHMGPMAEDFKAVFDLAGNGKSIATVDADGVALAAIQGLHQKLEAENAELRRRLEALEALIAER